MSAPEILEWVRQRHRDGSPAVAAPEAAEALDMDRRRAAEKLDTLTELGRLKREKKGARTVIWWDPDMVQVGEDPDAIHQEVQRDLPPAGGGQDDDRGDDQDQEEDQVAIPSVGEGIPQALEDAPEVAAEVLKTWQPQKSWDRRQRVYQDAAAAIAILADMAPERLSGQDFKGLLFDQGRADAAEFQNRDSWWRLSVRPALKKLVDAGLVEYREGHYDYRWVGLEEEAENVELSPSLRDLMEESDEADE